MSASPTPTKDDVFLLDGTINYRALAKVAGKWAGVAGAAIAAAVGAYRSAASESKDLGQAVKNKSEAGYQVTRHAYEALEARLAAVEAVQRRPVELPPARRGPRSAPRKLAPVPAAPRPRALPTDLDKAERQIYPRAVPPAAAPSPDAAP